MLLFDGAEGQFGDGHLVFNRLRLLLGNLGLQQVARRLALPWPRASAQAASTAGNPSLSAAARIATICRSPSSVPSNLRRIFSSDDGSTQFLNAAPFRRAPGFLVGTGT